MQKTQEPIDIVFPKHYLQKLEDYRKRFFRIEVRRKRGRKAPTTNHCKQAITLANKVYCGIIKEQVDNVICKCCPCYHEEPLEYSLFRRG